MVENSGYKCCFNQYRIITIEDDHFLAEYCSVRDVVKTFCKLKKNYISKDFEIDQEVFLQVEHLPDDTANPTAYAHTFNAIAAYQMLEDDRHTHFKVNQAMQLLEAGAVDELAIESAIFAVASKSEFEHLYKKLRSKLLRNQNALICAVVDNNGHIDYPKHETNPKFIQICKSYLHSVRFEQSLDEIDIKQFKGAIRYANLFSKI